MQMKGKQFENSYALALGQHSIHVNPYSLKILQIERKMERGKNIHQNVEKKLLHTFYSIISYDEGKNENTRHEALYVQFAVKSIRRNK